MTDLLQLEDVPCIIGARISKDRDNETSTDTQHRDCQAYVDSKPGWHTVHTYTELGVSAYKENVNRPELETALRMIERGEAKALVLWKLDRLTRSLTRFFSIWQRIENAGGYLVLVTQGQGRALDSSSAIDKMVLVLLAGMAELESELKRDRIQPVQNARKAQGLPPGGPRPFGYRRSKNMLTPIPAEAEVVQWMADAVVAGQSLASILRHLQTLSVKDAPNSLLSIKRLLMSPTTAGLRMEQVGLARKVPLSQQTYVEGCWQPLLQREQWETVCTILADPSRRTAFNQGKPAHLLSGLMKCASCGKSCKAKGHNSGPRYTCRDCGYSLPISEADHAVSSWLLLSISDAEWQTLRSQGRSYDKKLLAAIESEREAITADYEAGEMPYATFKRLNATINRKLEAATNQKPLELPNVESIHQGKGWAGLSLEQQRMTLLTLGVTVTLGKYVKGLQPHERLTIDRKVSA